MVSFCEAVYDGRKTVEAVTAVHIDSPKSVASAWAANRIPLLVDPGNTSKNEIQPHVIVDAILAKCNMGTARDHAPLVIGLGPGFHAGRDVHVVVETNRGHDLGRLIFDGPAEPDTGVPGTIGGYGAKRVFRAPCDGIFQTSKDIGQAVSANEEVARVADFPIHTPISGIIRGMLRDGTPVSKGLKAGDVDPRGDARYCPTISDKARTLGGAVMEAILSSLPRQLTAG